MCYCALQVQQPGDRAEGKGHHRIMLGSLSGHRPDTDAGLEQRYVWQKYLNVCFQCLQKLFLPKPVEKQRYIIQRFLRFDSFVFVPLLALEQSRKIISKHTIPHIQPQHPWTTTTIFKIDRHMRGKTTRKIHLRKNGKMHSYWLSREKCSNSFQLQSEFFLNSD